MSEPGLPRVADSALRARVRPRLSRKGRRLAGGITALLAFVMLFAVVGGAARIDPNLPLQYRIDALEMQAHVEHDYIYNDIHTRLHAPFELAHAPAARYVVNALFQSNSNLIWLCWLAAAGNDVQALNLAFLATFVLVFASTYWIFGRLRFADPYRFCAASLYALMPYHFQRGTNHFLESSYYLVPLMALLLLRLWSARQLAHHWAGAGWKVNWRDPRAIGALVLLVFLTPFESYYQFFFACLAASVAPLAALYRRSWRPLFVGLVLASLALSAVALKNWLGHIVFPPELDLAINGHAISHYGEAENYPLKLAQLILPVQGHRWHQFAALRAIYDNANPLNNENGTTTLGMVGAIGMLACMCIALLPTAKLHSSRLGKMGLIIVIAVLFAIMGGVSSIISAVSYQLFGPDYPLTQTRGWNRIVVFIAFFAYYAAFWILRYGVTGLHRRFFPRVRAGFLAWPISLLLLCFALWDAVPASLTQTRAANYLADREFFSRIESLLPAGSRIMQLPFLIHHESGWLQPDVYYTEGLRPYLNTRTLHFTYGGDVNSEQAYWLATAAALPVEQASRFLCSYGFSGVLLARRMVANPDETEHAWSQVLGTLPLLSNDGDHAFHDLRPFCTSHNIAIRDLEQTKQQLLAEHKDGIHFVNAIVFAREIGHVEARADDSASVIGTADENGYLAFGPYETLNTGRYTATFALTIRAAPASGPPLSIDIVAGIGGQNASIPLAVRTISTTGGASRIEVPFSTVRQTEKVEYRIYKPRGYAVQFDGVQINREVTL